MRIPTPIQALSAAAALALLAGCSSGSAISPKPFTPQGHVMNQRAAHNVAPGIAGRVAFGSLSYAWRGVHPNITATMPCTYLDNNFNGDVQLYNADLSLAGDFASTTYGWGITATKTQILIGTNNGSGNIDVYTPCTNTMTGTITGGNSGGNPYSIAGFKAAGKPGYATDFPNNRINYWATGSGTPVATTDPNIPVPYFLDTDLKGNVYVVGNNGSGTEELDKCNKTITTCKVLEIISGGFSGGVQVDSDKNIYVNNQYGTLYSYKCPGGVCTTTGTFVYSNGSNPLDYTAIVVDKGDPAKTLWGANIYLCTDGCSFGLAGDAQPQSLPLSSAVLGTATAGIDNDLPLGMARFKPDTP